MLTQKRPSSAPADITVIGAGIIGLATALTLQLADQGRVTVLDRHMPGHGASFGNAGTFATYAIMPLSQPGLMRDIPQLLFSRHSPFHLRWRHLATLAPWLMRFVGESRPARVQHNLKQLAYLMHRADHDWRRLLQAADAESLIQRRGCLYTFQTRARWQQAAREHEILARHGIEYRVLDAQGIAELEPALAGKVQGGIWYPQASHVADPLALCEKLVAAIERRGGEVRSGVDIIELSQDGDYLTMQTTDEKLTSGKVILAAGIASRELTRQLGERLPLEAERGYHLEYPMQTPLLQRPCCLSEYGFYMTPMADRLRVAGTVELGRADDPANPARYRYLARCVARHFPELGPAAREWMGCRPSLPDTLPVIGQSPRIRCLYHAFGHGHLGLTLGATTGALIRDQLAGDAPEWLTTLSAGRFHQTG